MVSTSFTHNTPLTGEIPQKSLEAGFRDSIPICFAHYFFWPLSS
jgi:hypothetical protein